MGRPDTVPPVGPPPNAAGSSPPIATFRMTKKPWPVAAAQVPASTWLELTVWNWTPSRYQRSCCGLVLRSHSIVYVWNAACQLVGVQARWPPMPTFSLHGPPGLVPQWSVDQTLL